MKFAQGNEGLTEKQKTTGLLAVTALAYLAFQFPNEFRCSPGVSTAVFRT